MTMEGFVERFEGKLDAILEKVNKIENNQTETRTVVKTHEVEIATLRNQVDSLKSKMDRAHGIAIAAFAPGTISLVIAALRAMQKIP